MSRLCVLVFAALLFGAAPLYAQTGTIEGRVTDSGGQPLPGANVILEDTDVGKATNTFGRYTLREVEPGTYRLTVSFVGYRSVQREVTVAPGRVTAVDVTLDDEVAALQGVVIQSEKFLRDVQDTRSSVSVLGPEQVDALAVQDWREASLLVGNFTTNGVGGFVIRGINSTGVGFGGTGTTAQVYVDGVAQSVDATRTGARGTWDLEAIEVFRGPQSTTAGRNALAGAVYLRSKDPTFQWDAAARLRGGTNATREGALMINGPVVEDQLAFRVSGEYQFFDTDFRYTRLEPVGFEDFDESVENEYANVRARLLFTPERLPGLSARLAYTYAFDRPNINQDATGPDFDARARTQAIAPREWNNVHNTSLEMRYALSTWGEVTAISGLLLDDRFFDTLTYRDPNTEEVLPVGNQQSDQSADLTQELRLNVNTDRVDGVIGGYLGRAGSAVRHFV